MKGYLILLILFSCLDSTAQKSTNLKVISAPLSVTTTFSLTCQTFETNLNELKKSIEVSKDNSKRLKQLLAKSLAIAKTSMDVRGQIIFYSQDKVHKKICFNEFGEFFDAKKYFKNEQLFQFLLNQKLIEY